MKHSVTREVAFTPIKVTIQLDSLEEAQELQGRLELSMYELRTAYPRLNEIGSVIQHHSESCMGGITKLRQTLSNMLGNQSVSRR